MEDSRRAHLPDLVHRGTGKSLGYPHMLNIPWSSLAGQLPRQYRQRRLDPGSLVQAAESVYRAGVSSDASIVRMLVRARFKQLNTYAGQPSAVQICSDELRTTHLPHESALSNASWPRSGRALHIW